MTDERKFNKVFSQNLNNYLMRDEMSRQDLAKRLGVSYSIVTQWCNGNRCPRMAKVDAMCEIFGCKRSDLIIDDNRERAPERDVFKRVVSEMVDMSDTELDAVLAVILAMKRGG